jgi:hypothetical protein
MKQFLTFLLCLFIVTNISSQTILQPDTCIDMKFYQAFCQKRGDSLQVSYCVYKLFKPVSKVSRAGMTWHGTTKHFNYKNSAYDKGHLVPAHDMSFRKEAMNSTFAWWNCVPQTHKLNAGTWKAEEESWFKYAQRDSIKIIVGACNFEQGVPKYCFKIVKSLSKNKIISTTIYLQNGSKIKPPKNFLNQFKIEHF